MQAHLNRRSLLAAAAFAGAQLALPGHANAATAAGGIGHNLPQEAPAAFAQAVVDASRT